MCRVTLWLHVSGIALCQTCIPHTCFIRLCVSLVTLCVLVLDWELLINK